MSDNVIKLNFVKPTITDEEIIQEEILLSDTVLINAQGKLSNVIIIGEMPDGYRFAAASFSEKADILMAIETFKRDLLNGVYD